MKPILSSMTDLFAFDGDARIPISRKADEYIFVNVSFGWGAKTYCYLCDDKTILEKKLQQLVNIPQIED